MRNATEKALGRCPDFVIGDQNNPYLLRWWIIPRNPFFNIYLHKFCKSDDDRALHDHPWIFNISILIKGEYREHVLDRKGRVKSKIRKRFRPVFRWGRAPHRVELLKDFSDCWYPDELLNPPERPVWTIFITGAKVRQWGFYCPQGWRHWREFVSIRDGGNSTGAGCD